MGMSPRLMRPRATGFNPKSIAGLAIWLDASDATTVTIGTGVSQWNDKSGNGRHFSQGSGNNQPSYTGTLNGKNVITFDGVNDLLQRSGMNNGDVCDTTGAAVFVAFAPSSDTIYSVFFNGGDAGHRDRFSDGKSYNSILRATRMEGVAINALPSNAACIYTITCSTSSHAMRVNGVQVATAANDITNYRAKTGQVFQVGNGPNFDYLAGVVGEVIQYGSALTSLQIAAVESYLAKKWGVTI